MGQERVRKLMAEHGIRARTKRKFVVTTDSKHCLPVSPDLVLRGVIATLFVLKSTNLSTQVWECFPYLFRTPQTKMPAC